MKLSIYVCFVDLLWIDIGIELILRDVCNNMIRVHLYEEYSANALEGLANMLGGNVTHAAVISGAVLGNDTLN